MGAKMGIEWTDSTWSPIRVPVRADAAEIAGALLDGREWKQFPEARV